MVWHRISSDCGIKEDQSGDTVGSAGSTGRFWRRPKRVLIVGRWQSPRVFRGVRMLRLSGTSVAIKAFLDRHVGEIRAQGSGSVVMNITRHGDFRQQQFQTDHQQCSGARPFAYLCGVTARSHRRYYCANKASPPNASTICSHKPERTSRGSSPPRFGSRTCDSSGSPMWPGTNGSVRRKPSGHAPACKPSCSRPDSVEIMATATV